MNFRISRISNGNLDIDLEIDNFSVRFNPTFETDALGEFVTYLAAIHPLCNVGWKPGAFNKVEPLVWHQGGILVEWVLKRDFEDLTIQLTYKQNGAMYNDEVNKVLDQKTISCNFDTFVFNVVKELDRVVKEYGILGYRYGWQSFSFPLDGYLALKRAVLHQQPFNLLDGNSTSLIEEIELIMKNIE